MNKTMIRKIRRQVRKSTHKKPERTTGGYILLEALVAVVILSTGVIYLSRALVPPLRASTRSIHYIRAAEIARFKITQVRLGPGGRYAESGEIQDPDMLYNWQIGVGEESGLLRKVALEVFWIEDGTERCYNATLPLLSITAVESEDADAETR